ncbi:M20 family metallopeptidase [Phanerochaete sordida]|uniref:M20 family metallopeptidase n=1 Tax=Phanerochaete sordida TaxID=48140 RepID=A0A9P3LG29_9APHY|nr:M20 family metallopeptidase [Phanerochaete sordida]
MPGCLASLLPRRDPATRPAPTAPAVRADSEKTEDGTPSPSSEVTLGPPLVGCAPEPGACLCCGSLKQDESPPGAINTFPPYTDDMSCDPPISDAIRHTVDATVDGLDAALRELSLDIWEHPEVAYEEHHAHDLLTAFMARHGFTVTPHYLGLATAWRATYTHGRGGRTVCVQAEMDALPGLGHACGHNLIAAAGVAVALALRAALQAHDVPGTVVLLGTPAEEHGGGKIALLERGAYQDVDVCIMCHPGPGAPRSTYVAPWTAIQNLDVTYTGRTAHAAYAPWEARNALDAAVLAYGAVAALRQQVKPTHRVHGVIDAQPDWEPNVIPGSAKMRWAVRAPTWAELEVLRERVVGCLEAAGRASACAVEVSAGVGYKDCRNNSALAEEYARSVRAQGGSVKISDETLQASTDLGDVSYVVPCLEPVYAIPTEDGGSNHTAKFTASARTPEAHTATLATAKCLAITALRVFTDDAFYQKVRDAFHAQRQ